MIVLILIILIFFILAGFFSGMETGLISLKKYKIEKEAKSDSEKKEILDFLNSPDKILGTTLFGTNISVVIVSTLSVYLIKKYHSNIDQNLFSLIIAGFLLVFSEIIPKAIFRDSSHKLVPRYFSLLKVFYNLFKPFVKIISHIQSKLGKILKLEREQTENYLTHDDLSYIVASTKNDNTIIKDQKEMLQEALEFATKKVENVMKHRTEIVAIEENTPILEVIKIAKQHGFSRFPVYKNELDKIQGILIIYDILKKKNIEHLKAKDLMRDAFFAPETMNALALLTDMKTQKRSMAIIVDSYGGTAGIVTIEDLLEELMGDIQDEYDSESTEDIKKIKDHYIIKGFVEIEKINDELNIDLPEGDYETIAGLIINKLKRIPTMGTKLKIKNYLLKVEKSDRRKIDTVKLTIDSSSKEK